jgi:shikimate dehydrogenase
MTSFEKTLGVLGYPLGHTLSPLMYNTALTDLGLPYRFMAFEVSPDRLKEAIGGIRALGIHGVALTIPHKEAVLLYLDDLTDDARRMGAVNLIFREGDRLLGHNTDGAGFVRSLRKEGGCDPGGKRFLIIGAGGAARGIALELAAQNAARLAIANRTPARAEALAVSVREAFGEVQAESLALSGNGVAIAAQEADVVIQCTSLGLMARDPGERCKETEPLPIDPQWLRPGQVVVDIVYRPLETPFLRAARDQGARTIGGLGMLIYQGAENFRYWTGHELPVERVRSVMEAELKGEKERI